MNDFLGVDCSTRRVDLVYLDSKGNFLSSYSVSSEARDIETRLLEIVEGLNRLIPGFDDLSETVVIVENPIYIQNVKVSSAIAQVVGAVKGMFSLSNPSLVIGIDNRSWKKLVLADGNAGKDKIFNFAVSRFGKSNINSQDLADASCIALWGFMHYKTGEE